MLDPRRFLPRGRKLFWIGALLLLGPPILIGLILVLAPILRLEVRLDLGLVLLAVGAVILAVTLLLVVLHWQAPKNAVTVGYDYRLIQPALPLGRYTFQLEVYYHVKEKGSRHTVRQGRIEMRFRRKDHPEILDWCCAQIRSQMDRHRVLAAERYPEAHVLLPDAPEPRDVEAHVVTEGAVGS